MKSKLFNQYDQALRKAIKDMKKKLENQLSDNSILPSAKKLLISLNKHCGGLIIFIDNPDILMGNNQTERELRSSVLGRKNYYASGSV